MKTLYLQNPFRVLKKQCKPNIQSPRICILRTSFNFQGEIFVDPISIWWEKKLKVNIYMISK